MRVWCACARMVALQPVAGVQVRVGSAGGADYMPQGELVDWGKRRCFKGRHACAQCHDLGRTTRGCHRTLRSTASGVRGQCLSVD